MMGSWEYHHELRRTQNDPFNCAPADSSYLRQPKILPEHCRLRGPYSFIRFQGISPSPTSFWLKTLVLTLTAQSLVSVIP